MHESIRNAPVHMSEHHLILSERKHPIHAPLHHVLYEYLALSTGTKYTGKLVPVLDRQKNRSFACTRSAARREYVSTYKPVVDGVKPTLYIGSNKTYMSERMTPNEWTTTTERVGSFVRRGSVRPAVPEMSATSTSTRVGTRGVVNERRGT